MQIRADADADAIPPRMLTNEKSAVGTDVFLEKFAVVVILRVFPSSAKTAE